MFLVLLNIEYLTYHVIFKHHSDIEGILDQNIGQQNKHFRFLDASE